MVTRFRSIAILLLLVLSGLTSLPADASITLVQHSSKDAGIASSSTLAFPVNNSAGNWIGVVIRAGKSGQVFTVSDTRGNTYRQASQFNQTLDAPNGETFGIFYAENIAGGANTVTVSESITNNTLRFAILEYSGVATSNSLDMTAAAQGTGTTANSGNATTTAGGDLVLGMVVTGNGTTYTAGSGFTIEESVPAAPNTKLIAEDGIQAFAGVVSAGAALAASNTWGAGLAAFKPASGSVAPSITSLNPTSGPVSTSVTITGTNFGGTQGTSTVTFNGTTATPTSWSATSIVVPVPTGATTGNVVVTVGGVASNGAAFTVLPTPSITSLNPTSGPVGTSVTITGTNFGGTQGTSTVTFNGTAATPTSWSATSIAVPVPTGATTGNVVVTIGGVASNGAAFTVTSSAPSIASLNPTSGPVGTSVTIAGTNFGATQGASTVTFNGIAGTPTGWGTSSIALPVPAGATTGNIVVTVGGIASNGLAFTVTQPPPNITNLSPSSGPAGMWLMINGTNFGTSVGAVTFNGVLATSGGSWSPTSIQIAVPVGATTGNIVVTAAGISSNGLLFTVTPAPVITTLSPTSGAYGTSVTVSGTGFGFTQGSGTVSFGGTVVTSTSWLPSTITFKIPTGATSGNAVVTVGGQPSNGVAFTVLPISVSLIPPTANLVVSTETFLTATVQNDVQSQGVTWSLAGAGCSGTTCGALALPTSPYTIGYISPSSVPNPPTVTVTATSIVDPTKSATSTITVTPAAPSITTLNIFAGPINTLVTISGANFGSSQGLSTVTFNGVAATTVTSWSSTAIMAAVPAAATSGNVVVTVGGTASNGITFTVTPPSPNIASLSPPSAQIGALVTIAGTGFSSIQGGSSVTFNGIGTNPTNWSNTSIVAPVPPGATSGNVVVTVGSVASNGVNFSVIPNIVSISPISGAVGTPVTIAGTGFGAAQGTSTVGFNGTLATPTSWSATSIVAPVPAGTVSGSVVVTVGGFASNPVPFTVFPFITSLTPSSGPVGTSFTINGSNFGATRGFSSITFNGIPVLGTSWSDTSIVTSVPTGATTGNVVVTVGNVTSNGVSFTVTPSPNITNLSPSVGPVGTSVTISGSNFGASQGTGAVLFNGAPATPTSWSSTSIVAPVPTGASTGPVVVILSGGAASNAMPFTVGPPPPTITSLTPASGPVGTSVTIAGANFGSSQGSSTVNFNGTVATPTAWSATSITVPVPAGATTGNVFVTVGGVSNFGVTFTVTAAAANIALVQHTSKDAGITSSSTLAFPVNNTAGNWIGVVVRAGHSGQILTVSDTRGNTYRQAVQFNETLDAPNGETFAIYYAENIAGGANTVTVSLSISSNTLRFAILEYSGVATASSLDVTAAAQGTGTTPNSGNATTTTGGDLVLGAVVTANGATDTAGSGFTIEERIPAAPNTKLIAEDGIKIAAGVVSASATLAASDNWGAALAAFKAAAGGGGTGPTITSLNPTSGPVGTSVTITGTNFGGTQGTSTVTFNGTAATPTSWSATSIAVPVPTGATTGNVIVTVGGVASNGAAFTVTSSAPSITSLNPTSGAVGVSVTITGTNFGASQGTSTVTFNGTTTTPTSWSATSIAVPVPTGATTGNVIVTVGGVASNGAAFTVTSSAPSIASLNPTAGAVGVSVTITGTNFGALQGTSTVTFNGTAATPTSWSATSIAVPVPTGATTGNVVVTVGGVASNGMNFTVTTASSAGIALMQHVGKDAGITTSSSLAFPLNNTAGNFIAVVIRGGRASQTYAVSDTRGNTYRQAVQANLTVDAETIAIYYAEGIAGGANTVTISDSISSSLRFVILEYSGIAPSNSLDVTVWGQGSDTSPNTGNATTNGDGELLIAEMTNGNGTTFAAGTGLTMEQSVPAAPGSKLMVEDGIQVAAGVVSGTASMAALDNWGAAMAAFRPATGGTGPHIVGVNPGTSPVGSYVTVTGTNFGTSQGTSTVTFNGTAATPTSWSATRILTPVPAGATSGNLVVGVGGVPSNGVNFTVGFVPPIAFVQVNANGPQQSALKVIAAPFTGAQTTGNLNLVVVGWHDSTATVTSVTDTAGNIYTLAVGPTVLSGQATQSIYFAKDILPSPPNTNVVTVLFSGFATNPDLRIVEYTGLDPVNPLDAAVAAQGSGTLSSSGNVSTSSPNDLLVAANTVQTASTAAGTGFTNRVITPNGGILEDRIVLATGSYSATASISPSGAWIMQLVAFRAPTGTTPPISVSLSPATASTPTGYGSQSFTATLQNDVQHLGVNWILSGGGCTGSACGTLTNAQATSVTYNAPGNLPSPAAVTLTAASIADNTKAAAASINVTQGSLSVALFPKRAAVTLTQVQQFTATVTNDPPNAGVVWSVDGNNGGNSNSGTISATGLFTPGTLAGVHTVTATSVSNASVNTSGAIAVTDFTGMFTYHYDAQSTGQNTKEYALTPANVNSSTFGLLFNCPVDGFMFANPLFVANMTFGPQKRNVLFVATEHNSVYAFDADSPSCIQLWKTSFLSPGVTPVTPSDTGDGVSLVVEFGISSTPVIDPATNTIYVVANTKEIVGTGCSATAPCYFYRLHALDLTTGAEKFGGPVMVSAANFNPLFHLQRPALLLSNGTIYIAFGSHADLNVYQGWLMGHNATTLAQTFAWSTTVPTGGNNQGAIWGSGNPPVADASGNVYVISGNGSWDGVLNLSDSVVKLSPTGSVLDYFTPFDQQTLSVNDIDFGSSGAIILPDSVGSVAHPHLAIATGKIGVIYLLDQTNLGKFHSGSNQDVQEVSVSFNTTLADSGFFGQPAYWNGNLYTVLTGDAIRQFPISNGVISNPAASVANKIYPYRMGTPSVSSNGVSNGIVWVLDITAYQSTGPAVLDAYDASHVATMLYSSPVSGTGAAGNAAKFIVPTVANGKVYVVGMNSFSVFGLLPN